MTRRSKRHGRRAGKTVPTAAPPTSIAEPSDTHSGELEAQLNQHELQFTSFLAECDAGHNYRHTQFLTLLKDVHDAFDAAQSRRAADFADLRRELSLCSEGGHALRLVELQAEESMRDATSAQSLASCKTLADQALDLQRNAASPLPPRFTIYDRMWPFLDCMGACQKVLWELREEAMKVEFRAARLAPADDIDSFSSPTRTPSPPAEDHNIASNSAVETTIDQADSAGDLESSNHQPSTSSPSNRSPPSATDSLEMRQERRYNDIRAQQQLYSTSHARWSSQLRDIEVQLAHTASSQLSEYRTSFSCAVSQRSAAERFHRAEVRRTASFTHAWSGFLEEMSWVPRVWEVQESRVGGTSYSRHRGDQVGRPGFRPFAPQILTAWPRVSDRLPTFPASRSADDRLSGSQGQQTSEIERRQHAFETDMTTWRLLHETAEIERTREFRRLMGEWKTKAVELELQRTRDAAHALEQFREGWEESEAECAAAFDKLMLDMTVSFAEAHAAREANFRAALCAYSDGLQSAFRDFDPEIRRIIQERPPAPSISLLSLARTGMALYHVSNTPTLHI